MSTGSYMELVLDRRLASIKSDEHRTEAQRVIDDRQEPISMEAAPRNRSKTRAFFQTHLGKAVLGMILLGIIQVIQTVMLAVPYQRELRIAHQIESAGGMVVWSDRVPAWIPGFVRPSFFLWKRIQNAEFNCLESTRVQEVTDEMLECLNGMTSIEVLHLEYPNSPC